MDLLTVPVSVLAFLIGAVVTAGWIERRTWLRRQRTNRIVVHMTDGLSVDGVLLNLEADGVVLVDAERSGTALAGEIYLPRERIAFIQAAGERSADEGWVTRALRGLHRSPGTQAS